MAYSFLVSGAGAVSVYSTNLLIPHFPQLPLRPPGGLWPTPFGPFFWCNGWHIPTIFYLEVLTNILIPDFALWVLPRPTGGTWPAPFGPTGCGWHIPTNKKSLSGDTNKSADTPFCPMSAPQGPQEAHGLHLLVPDASAVGGMSPLIENSSFESPNKSADTSFAPVSAPQGLQEPIISHNYL